MGHVGPQIISDWTYIAWHIFPWATSRSRPPGRSHLSQFLNLTLFASLAWTVQSVNVIFLHSFIIFPFVINNKPKAIDFTNKLLLCWLLHRPYCDEGLQQVATDQLHEHVAVWRPLQRLPPLVLRGRLQPGTAQVPTGHRAPAPGLCGHHCKLTGR